MIRILALICIYIAFYNSLAVQVTSTQGVDLIKKFECYRADFYYDQVGVRTIGYGHSCLGDGKDCKGITPPLTEAQAVQLLKEDLKSREKCIFDSIKVPLTPSMFSALVSIAFNIGCEAFKATPLFLKVNKGDLKEASKELLNTGTVMYGRLLTDLVERRKAEYELFCWNRSC